MGRVPPAPGGFFFDSHEWNSSNIQLKVRRENKVRAMGSEQVEKIDHFFALESIATTFSVNKKGDLTTESKGEQNLKLWITVPGQTENTPW